jgi:putative spermidine/putrescine transport system substrate-binding protein
MSDNLTDAANSSSGGWQLKQRRTNCLMSGQTKGVGVSKNTMRSASSLSTSGLSGSGLSRRDLLQRGSLGAAGVVSFGALASLLAACSNGSSATARNLPTALGGGGLAALAKKAKAEGRLNVLGVPPDWANYGKQISTYTSKFGIPITSEGADDSSAEEVQAIKSLKGQTREPDTFDVSPTYALLAQKEDLLDPYKVATWDTIPDNMKDPAGHWAGPYWGAISFGTNTKVVKEVPKNWDDLKNPAYKGMIAIDGDPRSAGDAFGAVFAAALAHGGSLDDIEPGINFFADLKKRGNYIPAGVSPANIAKGATPIAVEWDYLNLGYKKEFKGNPNFEVTIPSAGVFGNYYCDGVTKNAAHPYNARLWLEFLFSDEGQTIYMGGFSHPARYQDLVKRNKVPAALAALLPPASAYEGVQFPTVAQTNAANKVLGEQWGPKVRG